MSDSASWVLQVSLAALLKDKLPKVSVFDDVPDGAAMPYVFIGDDDERNVGGEGCPASSHQIQLVVVSSKLGYKECKAIAGSLRDTLDGEKLNVPGFNQTDLTWVSTSYRRHPDVATQRMALVRFDLELHAKP